MPRNAAGVYALPLPPVVAGATILASFENGTDNDIATELTNSLDRNGRGGMLAPFKIADGTVSAPGIAFTLDPDNGFYRIGTDDWAATVAGAKLVEFTAARVDVTGALNASGALNIAGGITAASLAVTPGGLNATAPGATSALGNSTGAIAANAGTSTVQLRSAGAAGDAAYVSFYRFGGSYAAHFGIDTDNQWKVGGWSMGANSYRLLHEGNAFTIDGQGNLVFTNGSLTSSVSVNISGAGGQVPSFSWRTNNVARFDAMTLNDGSQFRLRNYDDAGAFRNNAILVDRGVAGTGTVSIGTVLRPVTDIAYSLGQAALRWTVVYAQTGTINTSDARLKTDIADSTLGLAFIESLHPVSYKWITEMNLTKPPPSEFAEPVVTPVPGYRTHWGLIAQEVKSAVAAAGVDFGGYVEDRDAAVPLGLNYGEFIAPLIKAVQELSTRVLALESA